MSSKVSVYQVELKYISSTTEAASQLFVDLPINVFGLELSKEDMVRLDNFQQTVFVNFSKRYVNRLDLPFFEGRLPR